MIHFLILSFFGTALAVGLYCFWVALRVEVNRAPSYMRFDRGHAMNSGLHASSVRTASHSR